MAFDPSVPSTNNVAQTDIGAMRENYNQLRCCEVGATVANATSGMFFANNAGAEIVHMVRNKTNTDWIYGTNFPAGTALIFRNISVPTGWTQETTAEIHNRCLRLINTTAISTGGSRLISATAVGATNLSVSQMPAHIHTMSVGGTHNHRVNMTVSSAGDGNGLRLDAISSYTTWTLGSTYIIAGEGSSHAHAIDSTGGGVGHEHALNLAYVDVIIGIKD